MGQKTSQKEAILDMMEKLADVFKKYTRDSRKKAWNKLTSHKGKEEVNKILINPNRPLNQFRKLALLDFKEWMSEEDDDWLNSFFQKIKQKVLQQISPEQGRISFHFPIDYQSFLPIPISEPTTVPMTRTIDGPQVMNLAAHYNPMLETRPDEKELGAAKAFQALANPQWDDNQWVLFKKIIRLSAGKFGAELGYLFEVEVFLHLLKSKKLKDRDDEEGVQVNSFQLFEKRKQKYIQDIGNKLGVRLGKRKVEAINLLCKMVLENAQDLGEQIYEKSRQILKCNPDQISFSGGREAGWSDTRQNPADISLYCTNVLNSRRRGQLGWSIKFTTEHKVHVASLRAFPAYKLLGGKSNQKFERDLEEAMTGSGQLTFFKDWRLAVIDLLKKPAQEFQGNPKKFASLLNDLLSGVNEKGTRFDTFPAVRNYARTIKGGSEWSGNMQKDFIATSDPLAKLKARSDATVDVISNNTYVKLVYHRPEGSRSGTAITFEPRSERVIVKVTNLTSEQ